MSKDLEGRYPVGRPVPHLLGHFAPAGLFDVDRIGLANDP